MDISRILRNMPEESREVLRNALDNYNKTRDSKYAETALAILKNFDNDSDVKELIRTLKK